MDKYLRPERFDVEPTSSSADKQWLHWKKTFINFLSHLKDAKDQDKLQLFTNYLAPNVYTYIDDKNTYETAITALEKLYVKPKNDIYARHCLASRQQLTGETVDQYLHALKQLSKDCTFTAATAEVYKQEYVRDSFISGLTNTRIRQRLLENATLTLDEAYNQARALELAEQQSASYVNPILPDVTASQDFEVNETTAASPSSKTCYFCGYSWHPRSSCPAREAQCTSCSKTGHYSKVCQSKPSASRERFHRKKTTASSDATASITAAAPGSLQRSVIDVTVNNVPLKALIDTGSSLSFINRVLLKTCHIKTLPYHGKISMANSSLSTDIRGQCKVNLCVGDNVYKNVTFLIMSNLCSDIIIGHDILQSHAALEIQFHGSLPPLKICNLAVAKVDPVSLFANLTQNCSPTVTKSRRQSSEDRDFIRSEINRMLQEGIIEESSSPWRAQAFVVRDGKHKPRMVIDYSQTINKFTLLDAYPLPRIEDIVSKVAQHQKFSIIDLQSAYHQIPIMDSEKQYTAFEATGKLFQFLRVPFGVTNGVASFQRTIDRIVERENLLGTYPYLDDVTICGRDQSEHDENLKRFLAAAEKYNLTLNKDKCKFSLSTVSLLGYTISNKTIKPDPERLTPLVDMPVPQDTASLQRALGMFSYYSKWVPRFSEKVKPLLKCNFPLQEDAVAAFKTLKLDIAKASTAAIESNTPFTVETDASHYAIAATLSQHGRPVAFFSRTLNKSEQQHSSIEKEAYAIVESLKHWRHFLIGRPFKIITDQRSVSFMFEQKHKSKIKNEKIMRWRLELSCYNFDIIYRPGSENAPADALSRISAAIHSRPDLVALHKDLCHPGITRMAHWIRAKNLPFSVEEIRQVINACPVCAELKPRFYSNQGHLIKATAPFERLSIDFKGPLPSTSRNRYILTIIDEYSRFPFAFPCTDVSSGTVIKHLKNLFFLFGHPAYIHSDRGAAFMSAEIKSFLTSRGVATSRTTPYNPQGNGQCERYNGIIWKTVMLSLKSHNFKTEHWERVLDTSLHSIRSLLCTATNTTPHERMFNHPRRSFNGTSMPTWLTNTGPVFMKVLNRKSKYDPLVEEVELLEANNDYAHVRLLDGRETTVSTRNLAPIGSESQSLQLQEETITDSSIPTDYPEQAIPECDNQIHEPGTSTQPESPVSPVPNNSQPPRRPVRERRPPAYLKDYITF